MEEKYGEGVVEEKAMRERERERCIWSRKDRDCRGCVKAAQSPESIATPHPWRFSHRETEGQLWKAPLFSLS